MRAAYYIKKVELSGDSRIAGLLSALAAGGVEIYNIASGLVPDTDLLLSFGGDGTFLSAARLVCEAGVPVLGINLGRLGFLSDANLDEVAPAILDGNFHVEKRSMLRIAIEGKQPEDFFPYAINETAVRRAGSATLGVEVSLGESKLPTYWGDGLLVSTSSGSTAYSLSVGGPICTPEVDAVIVAPIAPHNLNVRPLVVPSDSDFVVSASDRKNPFVVLSVDNRDYLVPAGAKISVSKAPFALGRVVIGKSNFIDALRSKLFWGEDVRNTH